MIVVRSALFNAWFFGITFVLGLIGVFVRAFANQHTLALARLWAGMVLDGARLLCGIRVEVTGTVPTGAALIASQHQSAFDTLIWARLAPRVAYVYKAELARIPLFGPMLVGSGQIPVDRGASLATMRNLLREVQRAKREERQIVIFPEGTRMPIGVAGEIKPGFSLIASRTGLPVIPVATDSGRFWGRRAFRKLPGCVHIHIGEPISPDLPQTVLVETLQQRWRDAGLAGKPVDNMVDQVAKGPAG